MRWVQPRWAEVKWDLCHTGAMSSSCHHHVVVLSSSCRHHVVVLSSSRLSSTSNWLLVRSKRSATDWQLAELCYTVSDSSNWLVDINKHVTNVHPVMQTDWDNVMIDNSRQQSQHPVWLSHIYYTFTVTLFYTQHYHVDSWMLSLQQQCFVE